MDCGESWGKGPDPCIGGVSGNYARAKSLISVPLSKKTSASFGGQLSGLEM